ncbi:MAG: YceI family protein [Saprospiraceae bacterium]|nr:YceI family protein [Saprospiraceae bacterium]
MFLGWVNPDPVKDVKTMSVDVTSSQVVWKGYKVTGEHTGSVKIKSGDIVMENGTLTGGSFVIDMTSITCTDLEGEWRDKLVGHLKSEDFFNSTAFPTATMKIARVIPQDSKGNYKVQGNLTIKGITKPVKFFVNMGSKGTTAIANAQIKVDRSEYDVRYGSGSFFDNLGDKTIYDEFDLNVSLTVK